MTLMSDLLQRVERRLAQMAGTGMQISAEDAIMEHLTSAFNNTFDEYWWDTYTLWVNTTLDGETGTHGIDFSVGDFPLRELRDIRYIIPTGGHRKPLNRAPALIHPGLLSDGSIPLFFAPYNERPDKVFRIWPDTAEGEIHINYRSRPTNIDLDTDIRLDDELLVAAATYLYLADDGTNPGATQIAAQRLAERERKVREDNSHTFQLEGLVPGPVDYWWQS